MSTSSAVDPLFDLFGASTAELFAAREWRVRHGPEDRLPSFLRQGALGSVDALCRQYQGPLEIASGSAAEGTQMPVQNVHPAGLMKLGLTVFFCDVRPLLPDAPAWLKAIEDALGLCECVSISAFANSAGSGLPVHHDRFDQILIHLKGEKQFRYAPNRYVHHPDLPYSPSGTIANTWPQVYRHGFPLDSEELLDHDFETVTLRPGSVLFMPAGTWHTTAHQSGECLSAVVVVRAPSRLTLLESALRDYATQAEDWRAFSYFGWGSGEARDREQAALSALMVDLGRRLAEPELPRALRAEHAYAAYALGEFVRGRTRHYPFEACFERFIRLPTSRARFEPDPESGKVRCLVEFGPLDRASHQTWLAFEPEARRIVEWVLATRAAFTIDETIARFEEFSSEDLRQLLNWLSFAGLIRPIPVPEWDLQAPLKKR